MAEGESSISVGSDTFDTSYSASILTTGEHEYETQFLGFSPKSMCDGIYNAVHEYTWEYFMASQKYIKAEFGDMITETELHNASQVYLTSVSTNIDKAFDKFERYVLDNILKIPANVILPEDQVQQEYINFSKTSQKILEDDILKLKERIIAAKSVNASLRNELEDARCVQQDCTRFLDTLRTMERTMKGAGAQDVHETLKYTTERTVKVLSTLEQLEKSSSQKKHLPLRSEIDELFDKIQHENHGNVETHLPSSSKLPGDHES